MVKFSSSNFIEIRKRKQINISSIAKKMGISRRTIWMWEKNNSVPKEDFVRKLARILDIPVTEISDLVEEYPKAKKDLVAIGKSWKSLTDDAEETEKDFVDIFYKLSQYRNELKRSKLIADALFSSLDGIFYIKNADLKYVEVNKNFLEMLSLPEEMLVHGKDDYSFFSKIEAEKNTLQDKQVLKTGEAIRNFEDYIPGSKQKKWGLLSKLPIFNKGKEITGVIGVITDITVRKQNESLREILELNISSIKDAIYIKDTDTDKFLYINKAFEEYASCEAKKIYNKKFFHIIINHVYEEDKKKVIEFLQNASSEQIEYRIIKQDEDIKWIEIKISHIEFQDKKCQMGVLRDITERKRIEEMYKLLEAHVAATKAGIIINDSGKLLYFSKLVSEIYGYSQEEISSDGSVDTWLNTLIHPDSRDEMRKYIREDNVPSSMKFKIIKNNTESRWVEINTTTSNYLGRKCWMATVKDVSREVENENTMALLKSGINAISDAVTVLDPNDRKYLFVNKAATDIFGYTLEELYNGGIQFWLDKCVYEEDKKEQCNILDKNSLAEKQSYRILQPNGTLKHITRSNVEQIDYQNRKCIIIVEKDSSEIINK